MRLAHAQDPTTPSLASSFVSPSFFGKLITLVSDFQSLSGADWAEGVLVEDDGTVLLEAVVAVDFGVVVGVCLMAREGEGRGACSYNAKMVGWKTSTMTKDV